MQSGLQMSEHVQLEAKWLGFCLKHLIAGFSTSIRDESQSVYIRSILGVLSVWTLLSKEAILVKF